MTTARNRGLEVGLARDVEDHRRATVRQKQAVEDAVARSYEPPDPPLCLVSPETKAMLEAFRLPTYAEQCLALEMIRYKRRKAEKWARENPIPDDVWMTAFR